eukprot:gnl/MRDRNA2_/MRDRNA2_89442_c0_seq1.p1 gnl/MRDRNA2_/MRDRNA2_89442_c0~~gnl/MRDRNA2_/MRDRNA2_89442_c0_seq1.p1  ORF type:complete len:144 (+),score=32.72 gnl/MRDRNA2_/MRDRNA2_89442_c0_seq1:46-477(+)
MKIQPRMFRALCLFLALSLAVGARFRDSAAAGECKPHGAGEPEDTKACACSECSKHNENLEVEGEECVCFASDIMGTFENDATKTSTKKVGKSGEGSGAGTHTVEEETSNVGAARLPEGWMWHCRPITDSENPQGDKVWQQCD